MFLICTISETVMSAIFNVCKIFINKYYVLCTARSNFTGQILILLNYRIKSNIHNLSQTVQKPASANTRFLQLVCFMSSSTNSVFKHPVLQSTTPISRY